MSFWPTIAVVVAIACLGAGAYFIARSPAFWFGMLSKLGAVLAPIIAAKIAAPMPPEETKEWHKAIRRGSDDEFQRKRRGAPPKG